MNSLRCSLIFSICFMAGQTWLDHQSQQPAQASRAVDSADLVKQGAELFLADFTPGSGNPKTLRVRFKVFGFALLDPSPTVYLHYVRPNGKLKRTIRIGRAQGVCGQIPRTSRRKLFPFSAERGKWKLQFDTHSAYHRGHTGVTFLYYTIGEDQ